VQQLNVLLVSVDDSLMLQYHDREWVSQSTMTASTSSFSCLKAHRRNRKTLPKRAASVTLADLSLLVEHFFSVVAGSGSGGVSSDWSERPAVTQEVAAVYLFSTIYLLMTLQSRHTRESIVKVWRDCSTDGL